MAWSLANRPRILFLDEPTAGLDPASAESVRSIILEERQRGATVLLTTHDMWEADKLSDRGAFMSQGKIVAFDTPHNLKQQYARGGPRGRGMRGGPQLEDRGGPLGPPHK